MSANQLKYRVLSHLAEQGVPAAEDPWQAFLQGLSAAKNNKAAYLLLDASRRSPRPKQRLKLLSPAPVLLFVLLVGVVVLVVAQDRALAQNLLRFFAPAPNDLKVELQAKPEGLPAPSMHITTQTPSPAGVVGVPGSLGSPPAIHTTAQPALPDETMPSITGSNACSSQFNPNCTLQQAQSLVDFPLMQFQALPDGIYFTGAAVEPGRVTAMYGCSKGCLLWFEQTKADSLSTLPAIVGASAQVETVQWGDIQGEFVAGSYYGEDGGWNSESGSYTLRWRQGDIIYTISAVQTNKSPDGSFTVGKENFILLASSLTADLAQTQPLNPLYLTSIKDAQALAKFDIVEPDSLPEGYQFSFATFDDHTQFVCLHYTYNGASYPSLFIRQSPTATVTELKGYPGSSLHIEPVTLTGVNENASLVTGFASPNGACDADGNIFRAGQALLWQTNSMIFEIYAEFPNPFSEAGFERHELIELAENLMANYK